MRHGTGTCGRYHRLPDCGDEKAPPSSNKAGLERSRSQANPGRKQHGVLMGQARAQKTFVLVHGAWHGGWCWRRVSDLLENAGHKVFTPTLTGLGERSHLLQPSIDLATHIKDIANVIRWEALHDVVLVGHSYGGVVISGVAEELHQSIASLVFLDAFVPQSGDRMASTASQPVRETITRLRTSGEMSIEPVPAAVFRVNEKDRAWVDAMCTPHPLATFTAAISITGARDRIRKKTYIRAKGYPSIPFDGFYEKFRAEPDWQAYELPCGHDAMIDMPQRLAEILIEVS
jgi:pimeloyl-ACP methyl ester carboxylesterase